MDTLLLSEEIKDHIYSIRGIPVMLDKDLARLYRMETKNLKRGVRRNMERFPKEFLFQLTEEEFEDVKNKDSQKKSGEEIPVHGGERYVPFVFTEPGVVMLSAVFRSTWAIRLNIVIIKTFMNLRAVASSQSDLAKEIHFLRDKVDKLCLKVEGFEYENQNKSQIKFGSVTQVNQEVKSFQKIYDRSRYFADPSDVEAVITIQNTVATYWGLKVKGLKSSSRIKELALPRQIAMYLVRSFTTIGYKEIGMHFGGRDHTTILHAYYKISAEFEKNTAIRKPVLALEEILKSLNLSKKRQ